MAESFAGNPSIHVHCDVKLLLSCTICTFYTLRVSFRLPNKTFKPCRFSNSDCVTYKSIFEQTYSENNGRLRYLHGRGNITWIPATDTEMLIFVKRRSPCPQAPCIDSTFGSRKCHHPKSERMRK